MRVVHLLVHWLILAGYECSEKPIKSDYGYDYLDEDNYSSEEIIEEDFVPEFISEPTQYLVEYGGQVNLACEVQDLGPTTVSWRKVDRNDTSDTSYISVGPTLLLTDPRFQLNNSQHGSQLSILLVQPQDQGEYQCQVFSHPPVYLTHSLRIKTPPAVKILGKPTNGVLTIEEGTELALICQAGGYPLPKLYWKRKFKRMIDGQQRVEADQLIYKSITRSHSGTYVCQAERDGEAFTAEDTVRINVTYKPETYLDVNYLHRAPSTQMEIICHIQANPVARVSWTGIEDLESSGKISYHTRRSGKHVLIIGDLSLVGEREIACTASNELGQSVSHYTTEGSGSHQGRGSQESGSQDRSSLLSSPTHQDNKMKIEVFAQLLQLPPSQLTDPVKGMGGSKLTSHLLGRSYEGSGGRQEGSGGHDDVTNDTTDSSEDEDDIINITAEEKESGHQHHHHQVASMASAARASTHQLSSVPVKEKRSWLQASSNDDIQNRIDRTMVGSTTATTTTAPSLVAVGDNRSNSSGDGSDKSDIYRHNGETQDQVIASSTESTAGGLGSINRRVRVLQDLLTNYAASMKRMEMINLDTLKTVRRIEDKLDSKL